MQRKEKTGREITKTRLGRARGGGVGTGGGCGGGAGGVGLAGGVVVRGGPLRGAGARQGGAHVLALVAQASCQRAPHLL